jgi:hypothetical protein
VTTVTPGASVEPGPAQADTPRIAAQGRVENAGGMA